MLVGDLVDSRLSHNSHLLQEERILLVQTPMILDEIYDIIVLFNKSNFLKVI